MKMSVWICFCVATAGLITTGLVFYNQQKTISTYQSKMPLVGLSDNVRNKITKGHLWFEEFIAGDVSISPEKDVISLFDGSRQILLYALEEKESELGKFEKIEDPELRLLLRRSIKEIDLLEELTRERWQDKINNTNNNYQDSIKLQSATADAGSRLDQLFDEKYNEIQASMEEVAAAVKLNIEKDIQAVKLSGLTTLGILLSIFSAIGMVLFKLQRKSEINAALQQQKMVEEENKIKIMTSFADSIGQGNYDGNIVMKGVEQDSLAVALTSMQGKLKKVADEDSKRNWINTGLAQIGEILRTNYEKSDVLYFTIISYIVKYLNANQGGLFLISDSEPGTVDLVACVAFDRKKFTNKKMLIEEGLLGRCIMEKASIYLTEIPADYVTITSGLGEAKPTDLVIVPLMINEQVLGVLELASFYKLEKYKLEFIERIAESVASTFSSVKINEKTKLLLEHSQQQSEELRVQEEEMRQNMEELSATQEELQRKEMEYISLIAELKEELKITKLDIVEKLTIS